MKKILILFLMIGTQSINSQETIYFLSSYKDTERQSVIRYLMNAFELENPEIEVELNFYEEDDLLENILTLDNGKKPHLIMADSRLLYRISRMQDLDNELSSQILKHVEEDMYKGAIEAFMNEEGLYGLPYSAWLQVIWYRKDWFKRNGLPEPDTIENLIRASESLHCPEEERYALIFGEKKDIYLEQSFLSLAASQALTLSLEDDQTGFEKAKMMNVLEDYYTLSQFTIPGDAYWRSRDYFFQNQAAMLFYSTYLMDDLASELVMQNSLGSENFPDLGGVEYDPDFFENIGMITIIRGTKDAAFGSISGIGILEGLSEKMKKNIQSLIEFLYRKDVYISWLHMSPGGMLPVKREILEENDFYRDHGGIFKRYGRKKIKSLVEGLEYLLIINPELLVEEDGVTYTDKDFLQLLYKNLKDHDTLMNELSSIDWLY